MKANDLLNEKEKGMSGDHHSAIPGMVGLKTDQYFGTYKWSKDVAGHDGKKQTAPDTPSGKFKDAPVVGGYTKAERDMTKGAAKGKVTQITPAGSTEHGVNKDSPISGKKLKESGEKEMLFYAKVPNGDKIYARPRDASHLEELKKEYKNSDIKVFDFNMPEIQDWLEARRINLRKFTKGMVQTMTKHAYENANVDEGGMPQSVIKHKQKYANMSDNEFADSFKDKSDDELKAMAWRHGYGKDSNHYVSKRNKGKPIAESADDPPMLRAIISRIMHSHLDILQKYGPEKVLDAAQDVADWIGDVDEIGTSDVSIAVNSVIQKLKHSHGVEEDAPALAKMAGGLGLGLVAAAGAPAIVGILGPLLGIPVAAYGAYNAAKMGMAGVEKLWDMATDKLGSTEKVERYATAQIAKLPPEEAKAATAAIKQVAESKVKLSRNYAGKKLNEVNPHDFDSDIDYYNALKAPSRKHRDDDYELPDAGPSEEDMAHDRKLSQFKKAQETAPKQSHKQEDGIAPNGEKYNTVVTFSGPDADRNKHGAASYKEHHWGAKKVVDTKQGRDSYTIYVVDNHRRGYWKPWEDQPAFESKLVELGYNSGYNFNNHKDYAKPSLGSDMSYNWNDSGANAYGIDSKLGGHGDPRAQKRKQGYQLKQSPSEYGDKTDAPKSSNTKSSSRLDSLKQQYTDLVSKMHAISGDESKKARLAQYRTQLDRLVQSIRVEDGGPSWLRRFTESKRQVADISNLEESFVKKNSKIYNTK